MDENYGTLWVDRAWEWGVGELGGACCVSKIQKDPTQNRPFQKHRRRRPGADWLACFHFVKPTPSLKSIVLSCPRVVSLCWWPRFLNPPPLLELFYQKPRSWRRSVGRNIISRTTTAKMRRARLPPTESLSWVLSHLFSWVCPLRTNISVWEAQRPTSVKIKHTHKQELPRE